MHRRRRGCDRCGSPACARPPARPPGGPGQAPPVRRRGGSLSSPRRAEAKAGTRRRIVQSALEIFAREGYHATSMDAIAAAASVSKGALYHHFPGKLDLFSALVDEFSGGLAAAVT